VEAILKSLPAYMMVGIVIVVGLSQINRVLGAVLGVVFWIAVAIVGSFAYDQGGALGLLGMQFPRGVFYALCGTFTVLHVFGAWTALARRRSEALRERVSPDDDEP
jgi:hypothetical protein